MLRRLHTFNNPLLIFFSIQFAYDYKSEMPPCRDVRLKNYCTPCNIEMSSALHTQRQYSVVNVQRMLPSAIRFDLYLFQNAPAPCAFITNGFAGSYRASRCGMQCFALCLTSNPQCCAIKLPSAPRSFETKIVRRQISIRFTNCVQDNKITLPLHERILRKMPPDSSIRK